MQTWYCNEFFSYKFNSKKKKREEKDNMINTKIDLLDT